MDIFFKAHLHCVHSNSFCGKHSQDISFYHPRKISFWRWVNDDVILIMDEFCFTLLFTLSALVQTHWYFLLLLLSAKSKINLRDFTHCFSLCVTHKYCVWKANLDKNFLHPHSWPSFRSLSLSLTLSSSFYLTLSLSLLKGKVSWCVFVRRHTPPCLRTAVVQTDRNKK